METIRRGSTSGDVRRAQQALGVAADGEFGPATEAAVVAFQRSNGLVADGVIGPATWAALLPNDKALSSKTLTAADIERAAADLCADVAAVKAVIKVESNGAGFLPDGRPTILFERHVMRRQLIAAGRKADLLQPFMPELINVQPGAYKGGAAEHDRLEIARQIHPEAAIESASWGLFQIMGFHWRSLGYDSPAAFEARMRESEGWQLDAFVRFVRNNPTIHRALKGRDWRAFAANYNGPAYAKNAYDTRLAAAFNQFS